MLTIINRINNSIAQLLGNSANNTRKIKNNSQQVEDMTKNAEVKRIMSKLRKGHAEIVDFNIYKEVFEKKYATINQRLSFGGASIQNPFNNRTEATIKDSNFSTTSKNGANLDDVIFENMVFDHSSMKDISMRNAVFKTVNFNNCELRVKESNPDFNRCKFQKASFKGSIFSNASFKDCDFSEADFEDLYLSNCVICFGKEKGVLISDTNDLKEYLISQGKIKEPLTQKNFMIVGGFG